LIFESKHRQFYSSFIPCERNEVMLKWYLIIALNVIGLKIHTNALFPCFLLSVWIVQSCYITKMYLLSCNENLYGSVIFIFLLDYIVKLKKWTIISMIWQAYELIWIGKESWVVSAVAKRMSSIRLLKVADRML
jgi:hypothetical protein